MLEYSLDTFLKIPTNCSCRYLRGLHSNSERYGETGQRQIGVGHSRLASEERV